MPEVQNAEEILRGTAVNDLRPIKRLGIMPPAVPLDPREILAEDVKEALLRYYFGRRKVAITVSKTGAVFPMLCVIL